MKNRLSLFVVGIIAVVLVLFRISYSGEEGEKFQLTDWDAFGYYMYNPSIFIYNDVSELKWVPEMDSTYNLSGGTFYQASKHENGNYVNKYLGGVAIMQLPFFVAGHVAAKISGAPADGFSASYQYAIASAAIFYCLLGLIILRSVLLRYFSDRITSIALLFMALGTNLIQYTAIDGAQSHIYIFPLYALVLWLTIKWHESPHWKWALYIGLTVGLATICRPTELIMFFIPLLWGMHNKEEKKRKWQLVKANKSHVLIAIAGGIIGILPQLIYWKFTAETFIYDVGSKWVFFNPWFRVLFGIDNGFFIYTPIAILFILGFIFMNKYPFQRSVLVFCLLNIWVIISWFDWRYGATFSTRAMVQSYPVFTLALAALLVKTFEKKILKFIVLAFGTYMIAVNFFQINQYNSLIINYRDMNWAYYGQIYLNPNPTPLQMSLLDVDDFIYNESDYDKLVLANNKTESNLDSNGEKSRILEHVAINSHKKSWVKIEADIKTEEAFHTSYLQAQIDGGEPSKVRVHNAISKQGAYNSYAFYMKIPEKRASNMLTISIVGEIPFSGKIKNLKVTQFYP